MKLDLSIGQRLTIGFVLMLLVLIGVLISVSRAQEASARAQATYSRQIAPLIERAAALERSVYQVAIGVRDYVITPDPLSLSEYKTAAEGARDAIRALRDAPKTEIGEALFREVATLVNWYLIEVDRAVEERRSRALGDRTERALGHARQRALGAIRDFSEFQAGNTQAALAGLANARDAVTRDVRLGSSLAMLCFLGVAFVTARSVRRPVDQLLEVSRGFETGLWKPALAWAPSAQSQPVQPRDEMLQLRRALGSAAATLEKREERLYADAQVAGAAAASLEKEDIAEGALVAMVEHVRAAAGAVYLADTPHQVLRPIATYALRDELAPLQFGEGLPGQAVKCGRTVVVSDIPPDTPFEVKLGFEQLQPKAVAAVPILFKQEPIGVLVAASLHDFEASDLAFLRAAASQLAVGLRNAQTHERVEQLLRTLEENNRQLAQQNVRLQGQNERIQSQSEEIQAQNEEIQAQSEEIAVQNEALRENADELRRRAAELAAADERKNRFVGVLAIELHTPLELIRNAVDILKDVESGTEAAAKAAAVIERQAQKLEALVEDLNDVGRGKLLIERRPIDVLRVAKD